MVRSTTATDDRTADQIRADVFDAAADALADDAPDTTATGRMNRNKAYDRAFDAAMGVLRDVDLSDRPDGVVSDVDAILSRLRDGDTARSDVVDALRDAAPEDDAVFPDRDDLEVVDADPEKARRFDDRHPNGHDMVLVLRLKDDGTPKRRYGYDDTGRHTRVDNTTYKCRKCGVETGTSPGSTSPCDA